MRIARVRTTVVQERALWARELENQVTIKPRPKPAIPPPARPASGPGSVLVEIEAEDGTVGLGLGGGGQPGAYVIDHYLSPLLMKSDPREPEALWEKMYRATMRYGQAGIVLMAMSGVDLALWDLKAKLAEKPVWALLGDKAQEAVPVYATNRDPLWALEAGCAGVKFGSPYGPEDGRDGMRANEAFIADVRDTVGPEMGIMIDCSSRWDVAYAIEMADILAPYDLTFIEEPVAPFDMDGYAAIRRRVSSTRIAGGEHAYTRYAARELLRHEAVDILQPDIRWTGGLSEVIQICDLAERHGVTVMPHRGGMAWSLHLIVTRTNCPLAEGMALTEEEASLSAFDGEPLPLEGALSAPDTPGFGLSLSPERVRHLQCKA